jgi:hypothetical protein
MRICDEKEKEARRNNSQSLLKNYELELESCTKFKTTRRLPVIRIDIRGIGRFESQVCQVQEVACVQYVVDRAFKTYLRTLTDIESSANRDVNSLDRWEAETSLHNHRGSALIQIAKTDYTEERFSGFEIGKHRCLQIGGQFEKHSLRAEHVRAI